MADSDVKLEAISLLRFLPPRAAKIGDEVTRQDLRDAGYGPWAAGGGRTDDLRADALPTADDDVPELGLEDYDQILPAEPHEPDSDEPVIVLRFSGS